MSSGGFSGLFSNVSASQNKKPPTSTNGSLFGSSNTGGSLFGSSNTGSNTGGSLFGSSNTGGSLFGSSNTGSNTGGSLFGSSNTGGSLFGSSNTGSNTGGSLFGSSNTGGSLFGSSNTGSNTGGSLFGSSNTGSNTGGSLFGSSNTGSNTGGSLFGSSNTGGSLFGSSNTGGSLFGSSNTGSNTGGSLFGSSNTGSNTGGSLFGSSNTSVFNTNNPSTSSFQNVNFSTTNQNISQTRSSQEILKICLESPLLYGNQKDNYIGRLNQIKAFHGNGRIFCAQNSYYDLSEENYECAFKSIVYNLIPDYESFQNVLTFHLSIDYKSLIKDDLSKFKNTLLSIITGKNLTSNESIIQNPITICIKNVLQINPEISAIDFCVMEQSIKNNSATFSPNDLLSSPREVNSNELLAFFNQPTNVQKLKNSLSVIDIQDKSKISKKDIKIYLETCPPGIDKIEWQNACKNNPDESKYLPVVLYGFDELKNRCMSHLDQKKELVNHIKQIKKRLSDIKQINMSNMTSILNFKLKLSLLNKRFVALLCRLQSLYNSQETILEYEDKFFIGITQLHELCKTNLYNHSLLCDNLDNNLRKLTFESNKSNTVLTGSSNKSINVDDDDTKKGYKTILDMIDKEQDKLSKISLKYDSFRSS